MVVTTINSIRTRLATRIRPVLIELSLAPQCLSHKKKSTDSGSADLTLSQESRFRAKPCTDGLNSRTNSTTSARRSPLTNVCLLCRPYHSLIHKIVELPAAPLFALASTAEGSLTMMILLDQISRNIMRGPDSPFVFTKCDPTAQHVAHHCLRLGHDKEHPPHKRIWYYLALFHSESPLDQELALAKFAGLVVEVRSGEWKTSVSTYKNALVHMISNFTTIEKFGRFPDRNAVLNRESTEEEKKFLAAS